MKPKPTEKQMRGIAACISGAASRQSRSKALLASDFNDWWAKNHPMDWWANVPHRKGTPLNHGDRLLVRALCQRAYEANAANEPRSFSK